MLLLSWKYQTEENNYGKGEKNTVKLNIKKYKCNKTKHYRNAINSIWDLLVLKEDEKHTGK
jgi:hypothetical protein